MSHVTRPLLSQLSDPAHFSVHADPKYPSTHCVHVGLPPVAKSHRTSPTQLPCAHRDVHPGPQKPASHAVHTTPPPVAWSHVIEPAQLPFSHGCEQSCP